MDFGKFTISDWLKIAGCIFVIGVFWQSHINNKEKIMLLESEVVQIQNENKTLFIQNGVISQQLTDMSQRLMRIENKLDNIK